MTHDQIHPSADRASKGSAFLIARPAAILLLVAAVLSGFGRSAFADGDKEKADAASRKKWEAIVQFTGEEETSKFSLRIFDQNAKETGDFAFNELWKYDREQKKWVKVELAKSTTKITLPKDKPVSAPPDSQVLIDLPIRLQDFGLYYVKWSVDGVACTTYSRLGPTSRRQKSPGKPPPGYKVEDVPIDQNKAELVIIPDPEYFTGEGSKEIPNKK